MLIIYFLLIILILGLFSYILNYLYKQTNAYKNQFIDIYKFKAIQNIPEQSLDLVVLGSNSPKFAFDFSEIKDLNCSNWAIGSETFEYDAIIFKKFIRKLKSNATVILAVCPANFFLYKFSNKKHLVKYYKILSAKEFPDYDKSQKIKEYDYPLLYNPKLMKRLIRDVKKDNRLHLYNNLLSKDEIQKDAEWWIRKCWNPEFSIDIEKMQPLSDKNKISIIKNIAIVREIYQYCKEHELKLKLVYLPLTKELNNIFPESYVNQYIKTCSEQAIKDSNVEIIDYMQDKRFQKHEYYINSFFMNRFGAKIFTRIFINENIIKQLN